jgi:hypothetical protein
VDVTGLNSRFKPLRFNSRTAQLVALNFEKSFLTSKDVSNINFKDWKKGLDTMAWVP